MKDMLKRLKGIARIIVDIIMLSYGMAYYFLNKSKPLNERTPKISHLSMVRLFCLTSGRSNDFISKCISFFDRPIKFPNYNGILGDLSEIQINKITQSLETDGYYLFEKILPKELVEKLYHFFLSQECILRPLDSASSSQSKLKVKYDKNNLQAAVYDIPFEATISNPDIQAFLKDHSILGIAQSYLKTSPKVDFIASWWSTPFSKEPQSNAAQLFHFDLDRFKWLKFFVFLTDVSIENGPHVFVRKTHRSGTIPKILLKQGYVRHNDNDVLKFFPEEDVKTFMVPAGSILIEDTRGLHKGIPLINGERLVLEFEFSNSLFGAFSESIQNVKFDNENFINFVQKHRKIFKLYPI